MSTPSAFPSDLPERSHAPAGASWKDRSCPNMRSCWSISLSSYSLKTSDKAVLARRVCMLVILGLRTAISVLSIIGHAFGGRVLSLVLGSVLAVLGFLFIAWCLATIGDAKGYRKVLGLRVGRWHFDAFLFACAIIHAIFFIGWFFNLDGALVSWLVLWVMIFGVAWIAGWEPEPESSV